MYRLIRALFLAGAVIVFSGLAAAGESIGVVTSIKPVHSLVAGVMQGVATPHLIVKGGSSPHSYSLKPSDAKALENAKLVFWVGDELESFLERSIGTLAAKARVVSLLDARGLARLPFRKGGPFGDHDGDQEQRHARGTDGTDTHVWLDPVNAKLMTGEIARALSETDTANTARYKSNAESLARRLDSLHRDIAETLAPVRDRKFIVFHDGYQYFEKRYGLMAAGSITVSPEKLPGVRRVSEIRSRVRELGVTCVFAEPQFEPKLLRAVTEGTSARTAMLDPLGADLRDGPELYFTLLRRMANAVKDCLSPGS